MADPRAFISYDFDNNFAEKLYFAGQVKNSRTPFNIEDWSSKHHLPQHEWENLIYTKIARCNLLIVLVGLNTYAANGVIKEIAFAHSLNVPYFGVYVGGANNTTYLPQGLAINRTINWTWDGIAGAVDQMMNEGKNRYY